MYHILVTITMREGRDPRFNPLWRCLSLKERDTSVPTMVDIGNKRERVYSI